MSSTVMLDGNQMATARGIQNTSTLLKQLNEGPHPHVHFWPYVVPIDDDNLI